MAPEHTLTQIRRGMAVHTADGQKLGTVTHVWYGTDPTATNPRCDDEVCSRLEVRHGVFGRGTRYVPFGAIADVTTGRVTLTMDAATVNEHDWRTQPAWIAAAEGRRVGFLDDLGKVAIDRS